MDKKKTLTAMIFTRSQKMTLASIEYLGDLEPKVESYIINHNLHECKASKNSNSSFLNVLTRDKT